MYDIQLLGVLPLLVHAYRRLLQHMLCQVLLQHSAALLSLYHSTQQLKASARAPAQLCCCMAPDCLAAKPCIACIPKPLQSITCGSPP
jgi:hypothetical protein